jgi:hypothetical protein
MATGDQNDILGRLQSYLPNGWFDGDSNPIRDAVLTGLAVVFAWVYSILAYVRGQTRIKTASEGFLDLISQDFFGGALPRLVNETDAHFLTRIQINLFRERATRRGVILVLEELTGRAPIIVEPWNPGDCGAYGVSTSGYGAAGYYGSLSLPYQAFVIAYRPATSGIPNVAGYGVCVAGLSGASILFNGAPVDPIVAMAPGGYGHGRIEYASMDMIEGAVTDADIYAAIASVIAEGTIAWTRLSN